MPKISIAQLVSVECRPLATLITDRNAEDVTSYDLEGVALFVS